MANQIQDNPSLVAKYAATQEKYVTCWASRPLPGGRGSNEVNRIFRTPFAGRCTKLRSASAIGFFLLSSSWCLAGQSSAELKRNIAWQVALENVGFSPGIIDGKVGAKTELATREFQHVRGLPTTGVLDSATQSLLRVNPELATTTYVVKSADVTDVGHVSTDWLERSKLKRLPYENVEAAIAEKFHCSRALLRLLNDSRDINASKPSDVLVVPNIQPLSTSTAASALHVDLTQKTIRVLDRDQRLVALFHCSVAADKAKRPTGTARVEEIALNPTYRFDPRMWPEVKNVNRKLMIAPGPRNPVGLCWIGLNLPGYGMHGTPHPEMIGKTGSHGCFRLTNWDALRLAKFVRVGTPVKFFSSAGEASLAGR